MAALSQESWDLYWPDALYLNHKVVNASIGFWMAVLIGGYPRHGRLDVWRMFGRLLVLRVQVFVVILAYCDVSQAAMALLFILGAAGLRYIRWRWPGLVRKLNIINW